MIKILHSADWHLDAPMLMRDPAQTRFLREALAQIPGKIAALCKKEQRSEEHTSELQSL